MKASFRDFFGKFHDHRCWLSDYDVVVVFLSFLGLGITGYSRFASGVFVAPRFHGLLQMYQLLSGVRIRACWDI